MDTNNRECRIEADRGSQFVQAANQRFEYVKFKNEEPGPQVQPAIVENSYSRSLPVTNLPGGVAHSL
jgi:hypothetical protein